MGALTLIPSSMARTGYRFAYVGENSGDECDDCPVRALCYRLEPGRRYEVAEVRTVRHPCKLHDGDEVAVCSVNEIDLHTSAEAKKLKGTATHWSPVPCGYPECGKYSFCHPAGAPAGAKFEIVSDDGPLECPMHYDLRKLTLRRLPE